MPSADLTLRLPDAAQVWELTERAMAAGVNCDWRNTRDSSARPYEAKLSSDHDVPASVYAGLDAEVTRSITEET